MLRRPYLIALVIGVALLVVVEWLFLHRAEFVTPRDAGVSFDAGLVPPPMSALRTSGATPAPTATVTPSQKPCVKGRVLDVSTSRGVPGAQVTLAIARGVVQARADEHGDFEFTLESTDAVALAEVTAEGYFAYRPEWGHFPVVLQLSAQTCVSDLVLSLVPRVDYRGLVVDPQGAPVADAQVSVGSADEAPQPPLTTAADGTFTFAAPEGALVVARHPSFAPGAAEVDFRVTATRTLEVKLGPKSLDAGVARAKLVGTVVDVRKLGVPGAQVRATRSLGERLEPRVEGAVETDLDGKFSLEVEGPGPWTLVAQVPDVLSAPVETSGKPVVLRLVAGAVLSGSVKDGSGKPVQSFSVLVSVKDGPLRVTRTETRNVVDAAGRFLLRGFAPGPVSVSIAALGRAPSTPVDLVLSPEAPAQLDVTLKDGGRVRGRVVDRKRRAPLPGARVTLEAQDESTVTATPLAHAAPDGSFELAGLAPGPRSLFVTAAGHHARLVSVEVKEGQATDVQVDLAPLEAGESPRLELVGIGAVLEAKDDALVVKQVMAGGGAAEVGLVAGDAVLSIDGEPSVKLGFAGGVERIRGVENTSVVLEVRRADGSVIRVAAPRRRIEN